MHVILFDISREILCGKLVNVLKLSIDMCFYVSPQTHSIIYFCLTQIHTHTINTTQEKQQQFRQKTQNQHTRQCVLCVCVMSNQGFTARPVNVIYGHDNSI